MRVLIWAAFFPPHVGGYEKNVLELSRRLVSRGHLVRVITCRVDDSPVAEVMNGVEVIRVPSKKLLKGLYPVPKISRLLRFIIEENARYDIALTQTRFFVLSFVGAIHALIHCVPRIHVERGSRHSVTDSVLVRWLSSIYDHTIGSFVVSGAAHVVGVSEAACDFTVHLGARKIERIPNGISIPGEWATVKPITPTILYVGRLIRAKGVQDLLAALKQVTQECSLVVVGDGPYREQLQAVNTNGHKVEFRGEVVGYSLISAYRSADLFVNPSYSEGLPTSVMEAAALGIPVIATDVGGTREIIQDGVTGIIVKPGDVAGIAGAIERVLADTGGAQKMAELGKEHIRKEYSWDKITDQYCNLFHQIAKN